MTTVAGIDVGKANLDVSVSGGPVARFDNTTAGISKLLKHLNDHDTTLAVCEPTGGYERLLTGQLLQAVNIPLAWQPHSAFVHSVAPGLRQPVS